jgi:ribosomal subunit interface protein
VKLQVSGKNLDVTEAIVSYAERKLTKLTKHLPDDTRVELQFAVERNPSIADSQVVEATIWTKGPVLRAREGSVATAAGRTTARSPAAVRCRPATTRTRASSRSRRWKGRTSR